MIRSTVTTVGANIVVALDGAVDLASIGVLHGDLTRVIRRHPDELIVVDVDGVDTLDDAGLGVLLGAAATAREAGGDLEVVCTRSSLRDRLERTGFDRAIAVRSTIA
jgi:anti-sigma B factor antagonist